MNVSHIISELFVAPFEDQHELAEYTVALLIPILGAALSFLSSDCSEASIRWRKSLKKSRLSPPAFLFAIIWIMLYVMMGHSSFLVYYYSHNHFYDKHSSKKKPLTSNNDNVDINPKQTMMLSAPLMSYLVQCLLNHFYIIVLFGLQRIDLALIMIFPLWIATAVTTILFFDVSILAGNLMCIVLSWVSINLYFNLYLCIYNDVYTETDLQHQHPNQSTTLHPRHRTRRRRNNQHHDNRQKSKQS